MLRVDGSAEDAIDAYAAQLGVDDPAIRTDGDGEAMVADLGLVPGGRHPAAGDHRRARHVAAALGVVRLTTPVRPRTGSAASGSMS